MAGGGRPTSSADVRLRNTAEHASGEVALIAARACQPPEGASSAVESEASHFEGAAGCSSGRRTRVDYNAAWATMRRVRMRKALLRLGVIGNA